LIHEVRIESVRGVALGTGVRASSTPLQAQEDNPANLPVGKVTQVESYLDYQGATDGIGWAAALIESFNDYVGLGFSARSLSHPNHTGPNQGWQGRLCAAVPLWKLLSIGVAGHFTELTTSDPKTRP